jgi:hypothetical protein
VELQASASSGKEGSLCRRLPLISSGCYAMLSWRAALGFLPAKLARSLVILRYSTARTKCVSFAPGRLVNAANGRCSSKQCANALFTALRGGVPMRRCVKQVAAPQKVSGGACSPRH